MHGLLLRFDIDSGREAESVEFVEANVLPRVRQAPGLVAGYWWRSTEDGRGWALTVFESEDAARGLAGMVTSGDAPMPDYVSFAGAEVVEIDAHI